MGPNPQPASIENPRSFTGTLVGEVIISPRQAEAAAGKVTYTCPQATPSNPVNLVLEASPTNGGNNWRHVMSTAITGTGANALGNPKFSCDLPSWALRFRYRLSSVIAQPVTITEV